MASEYGYVWLPYAVAALCMLVLGATMVIRNRRHPPRRAELLLSRGAMLTVLAVTILVLADAASEGDGVTSFDRPVWSWAVELRSSSATALFLVITMIGSTTGMGILAVVTLAVLVWRRRVVNAVLVAVVAAGAGLLVLVGKGVVGRARPPVEYRLTSDANQSFPSGHALASVAILGVVIVVLAPVLSRWWRVVLIAAAVVLAVAIAASRIYLGVHWATDVLGGWLTGAAWLLLCLTGRTLWEQRTRLSAGTAASISARPG